MCFKCGQFFPVNSHTDVEVSTSSSEELNPPELQGALMRLRRGPVAAENPGPDAATLGLHLLLHSCKKEREREKEKHSPGIWLHAQTHMEQFTQAVLFYSEINVCLSNAVNAIKIIKMCNKGHTRTAKQHIIVFCHLPVTLYTISSQT